MNFKIVSNVPPPTLEHPHAKYPWDDMSVGDSFFAEGIPSNTLSNAARYRRRLGEKHITRAENGGSRIWRIA
jgi:hypothetical protein